MINEEQIITQYSKKVKILSRKFFLIGGDSDDLFQEGMIALLMAVRSYDDSFNTSFDYYAECCIKRRLIDTIKSKVYIGYIQIPDEFSEIVDSPEEFFLDKENNQELMDSYKKVLSKLEFTVLDLYLQGYNLSEIALMCEKSQTSIYNAIQRARQKIRNLST